MEHGPSIIMGKTFIIAIIHYILYLLLLLATIGVLILGIRFIITATKYMKHKMEYEKELLVKVDQLINKQLEKQSPPQ